MTSQLTNSAEKERFKEHLLLIEKEARNLQDALLSRKTERITNAVARQRTALDGIEEYINHTNPMESISSVEKKTIIQPLINRVRRILNLNEKMSRVLLGVIDRTLSNLSIGTKNTANIYNGYGRMVNMASPILVNAQG